MAKATRIAYSKDISTSKLERLTDVANRLGVLRSEVWQRYGSVNGLGLTHRQIRDGWLREGRKFDVPARLWKETLRDTVDDIKTYREATKVQVRKAIRNRTKDNNVGTARPRHQLQGTHYQLLINGERITFLINFD